MPGLFLVSRLARRSAVAAAAAGNDGVVALAVEDLLAGELLDAVDGHQALDKDFHQLDEESEFLHGNNQRVVLLAQMLLHELRRLPGHQFALGGFGAALGLGGFHGDGVEFAAAIRAERGVFLRSCGAIPSCTAAAGAAGRDSG